MEDVAQEYLISYIQSSALEKLIKGACIEEVLDVITSGYEEQFEGATCSLLIFNPGMNTLHNGSAPSLPEMFKQNIEGMSIGPKNGACGTAAFRKSMVIVENIEIDPICAGIKNLILRHGLRSCWSVPIFNSQKEVLGTFAVYHPKPGKPDLSELEFINAMVSIAGVAIEKKRTEDEIRIHRNNLQELVDEKTADLKMAKIEAEKANQAKSEFLSRMSHELRTPMNAILGFTQLMQIDSHDPLPKKHKQSLDYISSAGKHLLELINEVLDLSKIESGKIELSIEVINIIPIVDNVISLSKSRANEKGVSLEYQKIPEEDCFVEIDPLRFKQIVLNLISNAIKYNKPNGSVIISYEKQGGDTMRLGIRDTGNGIAVDKKGKLFKAFERFDVDAESIEGTGIGLIITKQLVELMGGTIGFESTAGGGSFFYVDIPISRKARLTQGEEIAESIEPFSDNFKKKILYVEDISANVVLIKNILAPKKDIKVLSAKTATAGIELARTETPDLILMDIHLPGMDGLAAFKILQSINETKHIPVIALTADAMDRDIKKANDMGFKDYITKPIDIPIFLEKIERVLKGI